MATDQFLKDDETFMNECKELISSLPRGNGWYVPFIYQYQGFWYPVKYLKGAMTFHQQFKPREGDAFLVTTPKAGTTWLKALVFAIVNRTLYLFTHHPLLNTGPHDLVPFFISKFFAFNQLSEFDGLPSPRLLATHIHYMMIPELAIQSTCRIVYLCRNPGDTFISLWAFMNKLRHESLGQPLSLEEAFELFCTGVSPFGPYWDHVLGYWKASLEWPKRVLFLKYEEMKQEPILHLKRLAEFLGYPFSPQEEREGVVEEISKLCSFKNLSNLEVNKTGIMGGRVDNKDFFRKGEVGDWVNYLTPSMMERLNQLKDEKFHSYGLTFPS